MTAFEGAATPEARRGGYARVVTLAPRLGLQGAAQVTWNVAAAGEGKADVAVGDVASRRDCPGRRAPRLCCRRVLGVALVTLALVADRGVAHAASPADSDLPGWTRATCVGLGFLSAPLLWPLSGGSFDPHAWAERPEQCMTLTATAGLAAISVPVRYAEPAGSPAFGAGSFDRFFRDALRSRSKTDNFLDGGLGDMYLPLIGTGLLLGASAADQGIDGYRDAVTRAVPLLWFGIGGNDLFVTSAKKAFGRKRPYLRFENERAIREFGTGDDARESFYSGHATTGFFAAAFTDRVLADVLQSRHPDYCLSCGASWTQWLLRAGQAALLYGLASYVGYSRIEIDKHYMTDVLAGAAIGALNGQLTYVWGYRPESARRRAVEPVVGPSGVALRWGF